VLELECALLGGRGQDTGQQKIIFGSGVGFGAALSISDSSSSRHV